MREKADTSSCDSFLYRSICCFPEDFHRNGSPGDSVTAGLKSCGIRAVSCVVAVAHHRDDSVETLLLNLTRGTGINGLRGIRPVNGTVVRPLLGVSREAILTYLERLGQPYVTDSTNLEDAYARNPSECASALREITLSVAESIAETASRLDDVAEIYRHAMQEACCRVCPDGKRISIPALLKEVAP